jgi:flavin-dependent dehydrogenase
VNRYDAVIIGGGPAGSACGIVLAAAGWRVAIVERSAFPRRKVCGEFVSASNVALLAQLGIADAFRQEAGPEVRRVGLYGGDAVLSARMPTTQSPQAAWGRALGRDRLDELLLGRAAASGATIWQPWRAVELHPEERGFAVEIAARREEILYAPVIVAAHGSWERGALPTQLQAPHSASDLLAFKVHFHQSALPRDVMPLLAFPGGYGGMVHSNDGRVSLSCCIRRDILHRLRELTSGLSAAEAVLRHIQASCRGVREALANARLDGRWLAAGPIRPGIRGGFRSGVFCVGNAAGEAHPVVAEGISMALQSGHLVARRLIEHGDDALAGRRMAAIGHAYSADWRQSFAFRVRAAALFAHLAMRPGAARPLLPLLERFPAILTAGASLSGKTRLPTIDQPPAQRAV